ncbi:MAG: hypothetical protein KDI80_12355, partial [Xanthomonadales bacterium]|nr:hypothetical protein [Xanthomonadales bacterium]
MPILQSTMRPEEATTMQHHKPCAFGFTVLLAFGTAAHGADLPKVASGRIERMADFPSRQIPPR